MPDLDSQAFCFDYLSHFQLLPRLISFMVVLETPYIPAISLFVSPSRIIFLISCTYDSTSFTADPFSPRFASLILSSDSSVCLCPFSASLFLRFVSYVHEIRKMI